ncbi:MAG: serine hydrolase [Cyclobacteriaceae bacterium]
MRLFILLLGLLLLVPSYGQMEPTDNLRKPVPDLPWGSLEGSGINRDSIQNLLRLIEETPPNDFRGLVVIKNNKIVIEEYFHTYWRNTIHDIRSAGKSITAMLLGVALKEGLVQNLEQSVYSFFPKNKYPTLNEEYKKIKLEHLLNMSSGLDADTDDSQSFGHAVNWIAKDDWKAYLLSVPVTSRPGKEWVYADINALLIGAVIEETSGMSLKDFAKEKIFDPFGIKQFYWYTNANNQTGAAGNLYLSTLDFAKLGMPLVNEGKWGGQQIIDTSYVEKLCSNETFDLSDDNPYADYYGMMWYKSHRTFGNNDIDYVFASGNGGNHLIVIPDRELVIALTSSAYGRGPGHRRSYNVMSKILSSLE